MKKYSVVSVVSKYRHFIVEAESEKDAEELWLNGCCTFVRETDSEEEICMVDEYEEDE